MAIKRMGMHLGKVDQERGIYVKLKTFFPKVFFKLFNLLLSVEV